MEQQSASLKKLSLWQVTVIGIAYMTPMTVFDTFGIVSGITHGHVPLAYLLALTTMLLTAFSYFFFFFFSPPPIPSPRFLLTHDLANILKKQALPIPTQQKALGLKVVYSWAGVPYSTIYYCL